MTGIFKNGVWSCGFDFLAVGGISPGVVFDVAGSVNVGPTFARLAIGQGVQINANQFLGRTFGTNLPTVIVGFGFSVLALNSGSPPVSRICTFYDATASGVQISLGVNNLGQLQFYQAGGYFGAGAGGSFLGTPIGLPSATGTIVPGAYYFLEILVTINSSTGSIICKVNGNQVISFSGNTQTTANAFVNQFNFGSENASSLLASYDDLYMLDTTASAPLNTFLGVGRIQTDGPNADSATGGLNQWSFTTPTGSDWGNAANIPPNAAQYDFDSNLGDRMSFRFPALNYNRCLFLNTWFNAQEDAAGGRQIVPIFRNAGADQSGSVVTLTNGTYVYSNQTSTVDPSTSALWINEPTASAGGCEIGLEVSS